MRKDICGNMQEDLIVFSSSITRGHKSLQNNLYDLLNVIPAQPSAVKDGREYICDFQPKNDKIYIPKKRNRQKVKTVRSIRYLFEKDIYTHLQNDLEKQQNILMKKISDGSARKEQTKTLARKVLKSENAISRSGWQMLTYLNPEHQLNNIQYVLWNGKRIRVNGSKGGKTTFLCNYDLAAKVSSLQNKPFVRKRISNKKKSLLHDSLTIKFKPGPLRRKKYLDDSYQKYNVGSTELVNLSKAGIEIQPVYGVVLEPTITNFLQNLRDKNGLISEKWAEFSVSALGTFNNSHVVQNDRCCVTFDLQYESNQRLLLMRRDVDRSPDKMRHNGDNDNIYPPALTNKKGMDIVADVMLILDNMINSVEISINQDNLYTGEDEPRETISSDFHCNNVNSHVKDKIKRNLELDRLDVTIIRLPEITENEDLKPCLKSYCALGCICASLQCTYNLKQHCGRIDCMFECKCDFSKYKVSGAFESACPELIPGLLGLDNEINLRLTKEEQKFHQTVVVTGEKSILLKSERRNWKASKKYGDFYNKMNLKTEMKTIRALTIVATMINCENIEPWCMVHNLYKCFCKGRFAEPSSLDKVVDQSKDNLTVDKIEQFNEEPVDEDIETNMENFVSLYSKTTIASVDKISRCSISDCTDITRVDSNTCARVNPYKGRKFFNEYYITTHKKILEMEKNDQNLSKRMMRLLNGDENTNKKLIDYECQQYENFDNKFQCDHSNPPVEGGTYINRHLYVSSSTDDDSVGADEISSFLNDNNSQNNSAYNRNKLIMKKWLECSYKQYKKRLVQGIVKTSLQQPMEGKVALYPWKFITDRYKERKNHFFISKEKPFRLFMAVDSKNSFFNNCYNINDITWDDLHNYPLSVRKLLANATALENKFCIIRGRSSCWELIGSVTKHTERIDSKLHHKISEESDADTSSAPRVEENKFEYKVLGYDSRKESECNNETGDLDSSKWFVMSVENDFREIQFFNRGFFVKYESIIKAINVARMSGKTVRLSSQKCVDQNSEPQFGIYAIPNANEYCVFIGPYDKSEPLGIETVKSASYADKTKRTRGVWITTKKIDNLKVIDNPLSFMPSNNLLRSNIESLENEALINNPSQDISESKSKTRENSTQGIKGLSKTVKPIKIRKTNGFYHLGPASFLKQVVNPPKQIQISGTKGFVQQFYLQNSSGSSSLVNLLRKGTNVPSRISPAINLPMHPSSTLLKTMASTSENCKSSQLALMMNLENQKPVAEIAPQIKIVDVYSESSAVLTPNSKTHKPEGCMFVLKPEEINERLMQKQAIKNERVSVNANGAPSDLEIDQDIERFLATSDICTFQDDDIFVISDEEDSNRNDHEKNHLKNVWIECKTIENLGFIRGIRNSVNDLSFEFPGFKFTEFYTELEAFSKINQVLSRKVYVPKNLKLEWHVIESEDKLKMNHQLNCENLGMNFVITKRGLQHKSDLMANVIYKGKTKQLTMPNSESCSPPSNCTALEDQMDEASDFFNKGEEQSYSLQEESNLSLAEPFSIFSESKRPQVADTLQSILSCARIENDT